MSKSFHMYAAYSAGRESENDTDFVFLNFVTNP